MSEYPLKKKIYITPLTYSFAFYILVKSKCC